MSDSWVGTVSAVTTALRYGMISCLLFIVVQVVYEVTVVTGDTQNAGTDTNIFITVSGANGSTEEMLLMKNEDRYRFTIGLIHTKHSHQLLLLHFMP